MMVITKLITLNYYNTENNVLNSLLNFGQPNYINI